MRKLTSQSTLACFVALFQRIMWEKALTSSVQVIQTNRYQREDKEKWKGQAYGSISKEARPGLLSNLSKAYFPLSIFQIFPSFLPTSLFFLILPYIQRTSYSQGHIDIIYHNPLNLQMEKTKVQIRHAQDHKSDFKGRSVQHSKFIFSTISLCLFRKIPCKKLTHYS